MFSHHYITSIHTEVVVVVSSTGHLQTLQMAKHVNKSGFTDRRGDVHNTDSIMNAKVEGKKLFTK